MTAFWVVLALVVLGCCFGSTKRCHSCGGKMFKNDSGWICRDCGNKPII